MTEAEKQDQIGKRLADLWVRTDVYLTRVGVRPGKDACRDSCLSLACDAKLATLDSVNRHDEARLLFGVLECIRNSGNTLEYALRMADAYLSGMEAAADIPQSSEIHEWQRAFQSIADARWNGPNHGLSEENR